MKVFYCDDFKGYYPVGTALVVVAKDKSRARVVAKKKLAEKKLELKTHEGKPATLVEVDPEVEKCVVMCDGDY